MRSFGKGQSRILPPAPACRWGRRGLHRGDVHPGTAVHACMAAAVLPLLIVSWLHNKGHTQKKRILQNEQEKEDMKTSGCNPGRAPENTHYSSRAMRLLFHWRSLGRLLLIKFT